MCVLISLISNDEQKEELEEENIQQYKYKQIDHENLVELMFVQYDEYDFEVIEVYLKHSYHQYL